MGRRLSRIFLAVVLVVITTHGFAAPSTSERLGELKALIKTGRYADAEVGARALLTEVEATNGSDSIDAANVLEVLVESLWRGGKASDPASRALGQRLVIIREKTVGPDHPDLAASLNNFANLLGEAGDNEAARPLFERALAIREKAFGPDHPDVAKSLNNLAILLYDTGDFAGARSLNERALAIREKSLGPDDPDLASSLNNLAVELRETGDYAGALPLQERALAIYERSLGPDHPVVATGLNNIAMLHGFMGDYAAARPLYERALAIKEKALGPEHPEVASSLNSLANLLGEIGDYAAARRLFERALAIREKALGPDHPLVARTLNNLAMVDGYTGDYAGARHLYERAIAIKEKSLGPDHPDVALSLNSLANLLDKTGDYAAARPLHERALAIDEKTLGPDHPLVAEVLTDLAKLSSATGDVDAARPLFERALAVREKALGLDHPDVAESLNNMATLRAMQGEFSQALDLALEAERIGREHLRLTGRSLSEREALRYATVRSSGLDLTLTLAAPGLHPAQRRRALDALVCSRAVVLDEMAARHRALASSADPADAVLEVKVTGARTRLANLVIRGPGNQKTTVYRKLIDDARDEKERAERALASKSVGFARELSRERIGLDDVAASLPAGSALVSLVEYTRRELEVPRGTPLMSSQLATSSDHAIPPAAGAGETRAPVSLERGVDQRAPIVSYIAFVIRAGHRDPEAVPLGRADEIDALVASWKKEASSGEVEAAYRAAGTALRKRVWDPLAPAIGDAARVFVVPDGSLNLVNLSALPLDDGSYLIERGPLLHYLSAERDLVPSGDHRHGKGLLAVGAPNFDAISMFASLRKPGGEAPILIASAGASTYRGQHSACGDFASVRFRPLPATGKETREIEHIWEKHVADESEAPDGVLDLRDAAATETTLKSSAAGRRVLHLATHGFFLDGEACGSPLATARGIGGLAEAPAAAAGETAQPVNGENPLLLSGLVLAGANHRASAGSGEDDGILTAEEIASLDLSGVEWAVLSACETGVGNVRAGEGVFGLRRAFQVAGAGTLIMSLWSVDDEATRSWMRELYEGRLEKKLDTAEAVRRASLEILRDRRAQRKSTHPFYWAAFVAAGDWR